MKKIISLSLMLVLFAVRALSQTYPCESLQVWMDQKVELTADGQTVTYLTIYEYNPDRNYVAFNMALSVPKGTQIHKRKQGRDKYVDDIKLDENRKNDHSIACGMPDDRTVKILAYSMTNSELYPDTEEGDVVKELLTIGLTCDNSAINGNYRVEMWDVTFVVREVVDQEVKIYGHGIDHTEYSDFVVSGGQDFPGVDYTLASAGYGTLILPFDCEIPSGLTAYECTGVNRRETLKLNKVNSFAANTPYVVKGTPGDYHFNGVYRALFDTYSTPYMTGAYVEKKVPLDAYVLQDQGWIGIAFFRVYENVNLTLPPYRCYLNPVTSGKPKNIFLPDDDVTGIVEADGTSPELVDVFTTSGVKVKNQVAKDKALDGLPAGIYIINNDKVIKK